MERESNRYNQQNPLMRVPEGKPVGVKEKEREGVFVNGFICQTCGLHFNLFSWKANRHRGDNTYCPECGTKGSFIHYRKVLSNKRVKDDNSNEEIFMHVPLAGSQIMADSVVIPKQKDSK